MPEITIEPALDKVLLGEIEQKDRPRVGITPINDFLRLVGDTKIKASMNLVGVEKKRLGHVYLTVGARDIDLTIESSAGLEVESARQRLSEIFYAQLTPDNEGYYPFDVTVVGKSVIRLLLPNDLNNDEKTSHLLEQAITEIQKGLEVKMTAPISTSQLLSRCKSYIESPRGKLEQEVAQIIRRLWQNVEIATMDDRDRLDDRIKPYQLQTYYIALSYARESIMNDFDFYGLWKPQDLPLLEAQMGRIINYLLEKDTSGHFVRLRLGKNIYLGEKEQAISVVRDAEKTLKESPVTLFCLGYVRDETSGTGYGNLDMENNVCYVINHQALYRTYFHHTDINDPGAGGDQFAISLHGKEIRMDFRGAVLLKATSMLRPFYPKNMKIRGSGGKNIRDYAEGRVLPQLEGMPPFISDEVESVIVASQQQNKIQEYNILYPHLANKFRTPRPEPTLSQRIAELSSAK